MKQKAARKLNSLSKADNEIKSVNIWITYLMGYAGQEL